jgi:hypothetical protein
LNLVGGFDVEHSVQRLLGGGSAAFYLVYFVRLELGEDIAEVVQAGFVYGLQLLVDIGCLRIPLQFSLLRLLHGIGNGRSFGLGALVSQLARLLLRSVDVLCERCEVPLDVAHGLHVAVVCAEFAQGPFDVSFDPVGEVRMRLGDGLGGAHDLLPWCCEDAVPASVNGAPQEGYGVCVCVCTLDLKIRREGAGSQAFVGPAHIALPRDGVPAHW